MAEEITTKKIKELKVKDDKDNTLLYMDPDGSVLIEAKSLHTNPDGSVLVEPSGLKVTNGDGETILNINNQGDMQECETPLVVFEEDENEDEQQYIASKIKIAGNKVSAIETDTNSQILRCLYSKVDMVTMTLLKLENDIKVERMHLLDKRCSVDLTTDEDFFVPLLKLHEEVTELVVRLENYIKWDLNIDRMYGDLGIPSVDEVPDDKKEIVQKLHSRLADIKAYGEREKPKIATKINSLVANLEGIVSEYGLLASARIKIN